MMLWVQDSRWGPLDVTSGSYLSGQWLFLGNKRVKYGRSWKLEFMWGVLLVAKQWAFLNYCRSDLWLIPRWISCIVLAHLCTPLECNLSWFCSMCWPRFSSFLCVERCYHQLIIFSPFAIFTVKSCVSWIQLKWQVMQFVNLKRKKYICWFWEYCRMFLPKCCLRGPKDA